EAAAGTLLRTALYDEHNQLGGRMVPFAGYEMPVQYTGIVEEHHAVRQRAGMFDVSHMGRFEVHGRGAARFLRYISTWDMTRLAPGEGHYSAACRDDGGILDDIYVFCREPERCLVVVNASNAPKMKQWMQDHIGKWDARFVDRHAATAMIAVQGPEALGRIEGVIGAEFVRRNALAGLKERGVSRELVCVKAVDRGVMRSHCDIFRDAETVGTISSGGYSPTLGISIAMGFVPPELAAEGTELKVDVRGR